MKAISAGDGFNLALLKNDTVVAWGANSVGELGDGTDTGPDGCDGTACSTKPIAVTGLNRVKALSAGGQFSLAVLSTGAVWDWGINDYGQLGDDSATGPDTCVEDIGCSTKPIAVTGLSGVKAVSAGGDFSFAVR